MGLLDGTIKNLFGAVFSPLYLDATLIKTTKNYDPKGRISVEPDNYDCKAQVDSATESMRGSEGFTDTDRRILILSASTSQEVTTDFEIVINEGDYAGQRFMIGSVTRDPAASYWDCRGIRK